METSIKYYNKLKNQGKINANIHYIMEEISVEEEKSVKIKNAIKWKELTNGEFKYHFGKGTHVKMLLDDENINTNAEIINMVLKNINE